MAPTDVTPGSLLTHLDAPFRVAVGEAQMSVRLAAPFVGAQVASWLAGVANRGVVKWQLLTHLDPVAAAYGSLSLDGLRKLLAAGVEVRDLDGLHGKIYLTEVKGFVTSANLTSAGLGRSCRSNSELTVVLDAVQREAAEAVFEEWFAKATEVTARMISQCERQAALVPTRVARIPIESPTEKKSSDLADDLLAESMKAGVWVKAIYDDGSSADEHDWMSGGSIANPENKGRPKIAEGDLVVIWARRARSCYAVVRVTSSSEHNPQRAMDEGIAEADAIRWPWLNGIEGVVQVLAAEGLPLEELGLTGQSLQGGYCRMPTGGFLTVVQWLSE